MKFSPTSISPVTLLDNLLQFSNRFLEIRKCYTVNVTVIVTVTEKNRIKKYVDMHRETTIYKKEVKWFHLSRERIMKKLERKDSCFKGMVTQLRNSSALGRVTEYFTVLNEYQERESR